MLYEGKKGFNNHRSAFAEPSGLELGIYWVFQPLAALRPDLRKCIGTAMALPHPLITLRKLAVNGFKDVLGRVMSAAMAIALDTEQSVLQNRFNERFIKMKHQLVVSYQTFSGTPQDRAIAAKGGRANVIALAERYGMDASTEEGRFMAMSRFSHEGWKKRKALPEGGSQFIKMRSITRIVAGVANRLPRMPLKMLWIV